MGYWLDLGFPCRLGMLDFGFLHSWEDFQKDREDSAEFELNTVLLLPIPHLPLTINHYSVICIAVSNTPCYLLKLKSLWDRDFLSLYVPLNDVLPMRSII